MIKREEEQHQPCQGLIHLAKANDQHLVLGLACFKLVVAKLAVPEEEALKYVQQAAREVGEIKMALLHRRGEHTEKVQGLSGEILRGMKFDA